LILVRIEGSHFLWKMVRRVVGVLVEVGRGALPQAEAIALLQTRSGLPARLTAPASGLFLEHVYYPGDRRAAGQPPIVLHPYAVDVNTRA
jgi:tRNA pseudouridine38-40 synthase